MTQDQFYNLAFIINAIPVEKSDTKDLSNPGILFLDQNSTEGNVKVDLLEGGTVTIALTKANSTPFFVVKKVHSTNTTAVGIYVSPITKPK
jgi:hypothetical protein